ncbi:predicted protein [Arabidopsis lyrata subsp. lyrata]|uniref:Predicted protein n=1 Tax=Arabidopsis lyrata subsp. lyrata TaxID=81972 RepID=D7LFI5_ARALL|nr:predicted protein [Arabidopsis lyrata subsp. lyrata]
MEYDSGSGSGRGRGRSIPLVAGRANNVQISDAIGATAHTITSIDREGLSLTDSQWKQLITTLRLPHAAPITPSNILAEDYCLVSSLTQTVLDERGISMEDIEVIVESGVADVGGSIDSALRLVDPVQNTAEPAATIDR